VSKSVEGQLSKSKSWI